MKILLRPITKEHGPLIVKWRNSPKIRAHCFTKAPITIKSNTEFYKKNIETGKYKQFIVERIDEDYGLASYPIATVYLKDIDNENNRCELCIFTSDDIEWDAIGQSIAIKLLLDKAFNELNLHKVYSYVFYQYADEVELLKQSGFSVEAILKEEAKGENGKYLDVVRMSVFNPNQQTV